MSKFRTGKISCDVEGFTLIEVLVALAILSVFLAIIFSAFSDALRGRRAAEEYQQATLLAESKLNSIGIDEPAEVGNAAGRFDDRFWWNTVVTPYREEGADASQDQLRRPLQFAVTVSWLDPNGGQKSVTLATMRLVPR